jgi:hypothetical protein
MSPTVLRSGPYRFHFYSQGGGEPAHVHVDRDDCSAKFWLNPVGFEYNLGYSAIELRIIQRIIEENRVMLIRKWNEYFRA